jgi:hypothetical protein
MLEAEFSRRSRHPKRTEFARPSINNVECMSSFSSHGNLILLSVSSQMMFEI